jgi:hypothetical protein
MTCDSGGLRTRHANGRMIADQHACRHAGVRSRGRADGALRTSNREGISFSRSRYRARRSTVPRNSETTCFLAELGIIFLMFMAGLEFSLPAMIAARREVFVAGSL